MITAEPVRASFLGGLTLRELLRRTARESWEDSVFGQGGRMAFYQFLAIFPAIAVCLAVAPQAHHFGNPIQKTFRDIFSEVLPIQVAGLLQNAMSEIRPLGITGWRLMVVSTGAAWALLNSIWAMVYGLNRAFEAKERRSGWQLGTTIVGLSAAMVAIGYMAVLVVFVCIPLAWNAIMVHAFDWLVLAAALSLWFALLYRFAPDLSDHKWRCSIPGALAALILWVGATFAARVYFDHVDNYSRSFGGLNGVAMLLLWLYVTNGAILIGGEMNSEIEKAANRHCNGDDYATGHSCRGDVVS